MVSYINFCSTVIATPVKTLSASSPMQYISVFTWLAWDYVVEVTCHSEVFKLSYPLFPLVWFWEVEGLRLIYRERSRRFCRGPLRFVLLFTLLNQLLPSLWYAYGQILLLLMSNSPFLLLLVYSPLSFLTLAHFWHRVMLDSFKVGE